MPDASQPTVSRHRIATLTPAQVRALWELWHVVFPRPEATLEERETRFRNSPLARDGDLFVVWDGAGPLATAAISPREIHTARGPLVVLALAGVASAPHRRGDGFGRAVTRAALAEVDRGAFAVALFQTGVPAFYAKLGARLVDNRFVNSLHDPRDPTNVGRGSAENPWWSPHITIYPSGYDWPAGQIDLRGPGY